MNWTDHSPAPRITGGVLRLPSGRATRLAPFVLAVLLTGCASAGTMQTGPAPESAGPARSSPANASGPVPSATDADRLARLEAIYEARQAAALENVSEADVRFMTGMIHHHAQALTMSGYAAENGASRSVQTLAARIINAQRDEIANMRRWLLDRNRPTPDVADDGTVTMPAEAPAAGDTASDHGAMAHGDPDHGQMDHGAMDHGAGGQMVMDHTTMAGMLSPEQLAELRDARGEDFDRLFLTYMIRHHEGAVTMVLDLFGTDGAAQDDLIFKIASDIQVDQTTEINRMRLMLDAMEGGA